MLLRRGARAEGDAIKPFSLGEEVAASIITGNFVFRGLKWGIGAIFAGRTTEIILSESRTLTTYYPNNDGFLGAATQLTLKEGQIINRFWWKRVFKIFFATGSLRICSLVASRCG